MSTHSPSRPSLPFSSLLKAIPCGLLGAACFSDAEAQPSRPGTNVETSYSFSAAGDAEFAGTTSGEIEVNAFAVSAAQTFRVNETFSFSAGAAYRHFAIDVSGGAPVSEELRSAALELGATWKLAPQWSLTARVMPGIYTDGESFDSDGFNAPALLIATWRYSDTWTFFGGARVDAFDENPVLPALGFRWQATPEVVVSVGLPRTEIAYAFDESRSVFFGANFQGGAFHTDDPAVVAPPGYQSLRDTEVSYREIRLGAGYRWALTDTLSLEVEGGWVVDRRFEYDDRDFTVNTDDAAYGRLHLSARF